MREERWQRLTSWPLLIVSVAYVVAYSWRVIADLDGAAQTAVRAVMIATWAMFAVDYLVRLALADDRGRWFRGHLLDLAVIAIPPLRILRLLKAFTVIARFGHSRGYLFRRRIAVYGIGAAVMLIWVAALGVLDVERDAPGATIVHLGDALWWAIVTVATVGYGDYTPVTVWGRIIATALMAGGVAVLAVVTATVSSWVNEKVAAARPVPDGDGAEGSAE